MLALRTRENSQNLSALDFRGGRGPIALPFPPSAYGLKPPQDSPAVEVSLWVKEFIWVEIHCL